LKFLHIIHKNPVPKSEEMNFLHIIKTNILMAFKYIVILCTEHCTKKASTLLS
jgi:hypothetical protein